MHNFKRFYKLKKISCILMKLVSTAFRLRIFHIAFILEYVLRAAFQTELQA